MARTFSIKLPTFFRAASPENPRTSLSNPASWLTALFAPASKSGATVSVKTVISLPGVWRAISVVSGSLGTLPFEIVEEGIDGSVQPAKTHPLYHLMRWEPSPSYTSFIFIRSLVAQAMFFGNGYAIIHREGESGNDRPVGFTILDQANFPVTVIVEKDAFGRDAPFYIYKGLTYRQDQVIHIQNLGFTGIAGQNLMEVHRENYGLGLSSRDFGNEFFRNGAFMSGYMSTDKSLTLEARQRQAKSFAQAYGGVDKAGSVAFLDEGMKFYPLSIKPSDASMLETQKYSLEDIARIMGVPPHLLYALDRATHNNIEQLSQEFANYTIGPWATQLEQEFSRKIFREYEKKFTRTGQSRYRMQFDMNELLKADADSRAKLYQSGIHTGWMTPNEARRREGLNPVEGGNNNFIQMQYTTLDRAASQELGSNPASNTPNDEQAQ